MNKIHNISRLEGNMLELHYWFNDSSHTMDAIIQNKCEAEFLSILKEIANHFETTVSIETEPLEAGGLRRWFKIDSNDAGLKKTVKIAVITSLATAVIVTPVTVLLTKTSESIIENIFEDKELKEAEKEKLKLEVIELKQKIKLNNKKIEENNKIKKKKSNFYEHLAKCKKVKKVSFSVASEKKDRVISEESVIKRDFDKYILVNDHLPSEIKEEASIEIISPVLKKGPYKWQGIYNGESIHFSMKSNEFKTLIQSGAIEFKNGSSIYCHLEIKKKIDNEGVTKIVGYSV